MGQNALGQADYRIPKSNISLEQSDEIAWFLHVDGNPRKLKVEWNIVV